MSWFILFCCNPRNGYHINCFKRFCEIDGIFMRSIFTMSSYVALFCLGLHIQYSIQFNKFNLITTLWININTFSTVLKYSNRINNLQRMLKPTSEKSARQITNSRRKKAKAKKTDNIQYRSTHIQCTTQIRHFDCDKLLFLFLFEI